MHIDAPFCMLDLYIEIDVSTYFALQIILLITFTPHFVYSYYAVATAICLIRIFDMYIGFSYAIKKPIIQTGFEKSHELPTKQSKPS